jgi:hypothetical protein
MQEWCLLSLGFTTNVIVAASQKYNWGNIGIGWVFEDMDEACCDWDEAKSVNVPGARKAKEVGGNITHDVVLRNRVIHKAGWRQNSFPTRAGQELTAGVLSECTK